MLKRGRAGALILAFLLLLSSCGGKEKTASVTAEQDVSGKLTIYTSIYEDIIDQLKGKMKEKFPNLEVEFFQGGTGAIQSKVAAEMSSGKIDCDMLLVAEPSYSLELKEKGMLYPYVSAEAKNINPDLNYDKEGYWYPVRICNMVLAYNPEKVGKDKIAQSFEEFANKTELKGKISMSNPLTSGTALASVSALVDKYGEGYFDALSKQDVAVESGSVALGKLETGECQEIMVLEESVLKKREEEKSPLEVIYPTDGSIIIPSTVMSVAKGKSKNDNQKACEKVTDWLLSPEGQDVMVKGWMYSVLKNPPSEPYDGKKVEDLIKKAMPVNWEKTYKEREKLRTQFESKISIPEKK